MDKEKIHLPMLFENIRSNFVCLHLYAHERLRYRLAQLFYLFDKLDDRAILEIRTRIAELLKSHKARIGLSENAVSIST